MSQETENFDSLRRLLAIKRHEQPPPGYFHNFSGEVVARIKAGDRGEDAYGYVWQMGWLQRLWAAFEARPALAGALGLAICSLVVFGVISADNDKVGDLQAVTAVPASDVQASGMSIADNDSSSPVGPASIELANQNPMRAVASTSLFDLVPQGQAQPSNLHLTLATSGN